MKRAGRFATLSLLLAAGLAACRRTDPGTPASSSVPADLRAAVGRELSLDLSRTDPDLSLVTLKPTITDIDVVALTLGLEVAFSVDITPDASFEILGARANQAPLKLTLRNLARLVASAPHAEHPPAPASADAVAADADEADPELPKLVSGAYFFRCPLAGLRSGRVRVDRKSRLALFDGRRTLVTVSLDGDFYGADAEMTCADGYVVIRHKQQNGRDRVLSYAWKQGRLELNVKGDEVPVKAPQPTR